MEGVLSLKRRIFWSERITKIICVLVFLVALSIYLYVGFQPAASTDYSYLPKLKIPSIGLDAPVTQINLEDHQLIAPNEIAGVYQPYANKLFIIGHSSTIFRNLEQVPSNASFTYNDATYQIKEKSVLAKSDINMSTILADEVEPTIIIMTCAGTPLARQDATHRLIITATKVPRYTNITSFATSLPTLSH